MRIQNLEKQSILSLFLGKKLGMWLYVVGLQSLPKPYYYIVHLECIPISFNPAKGQSSMLARNAHLFEIGTRGLEEGFPCLNLARILLTSSLNTAQESCYIQYGCTSLIRRAAKLAVLGGGTMRSFVIVIDLKN